MGHPFLRTSFLSSSPLSLSNFPSIYFTHFYILPSIHCCCCCLLLYLTALGTLYAYQNAVKLARELHNMDLDAGLKDGSLAVGLYHTAGKGTRLAPLPGAENNNKPGVKLAATVKVAGLSVPMTILEGVVKQTGCYAKSRKGRLSVL